MSAAMAKSDYSFDGKRVFVTGADGFIGSHLAEALVRRGAKVTALALYNSFGTCGWLDEIADEVRGEMRIELGDVRDGVQMRAFADGSDIIFHLAALIGIPYSYVAAASCVDVNIHGTLNMLEAVRGGAAARLIHTSTSEVYGSALQRPISEEQAKAAPALTPTTTRGGGRKEETTDQNPACQKQRQPPPAKTTDSKKFDPAPDRRDFQALSLMTTYSS